MVTCPTPLYSSPLPSPEPGVVSHHVVEPVSPKLYAPKCIGTDELDFPDCSPSASSGGGNPGTALANSSRHASSAAS